MKHQRPVLPQRDADLTRKLTAILKEAQSIKPGMTRGQLLLNFTTEGGISQREKRRYVSTKCALVKIEVEFKPVGAPSKNGEEPADVIVKVSPPFLEWSIMD